MTVRVEFYGIVRRRAGIAELDVEAATLAEVLAEVETRLPQLAATCLENGRLRPGYLANIDGRSFTTAGTTPIASGSTVMLLSADAGG